jgi:ABC-2 type transport system ATP-binding protein
MSATIEAKEVSKRFGSHLALDRLSLEVPPGEAFGLIGPNGAGKTTFLRILTGYRLPSAGDIVVDGLSVARERAQVQARLGYACEQPRLYLDHRVETFLRLMGELRGLGGPRLRAAVEREIERFALGEVRRRPIAVLSKGFRQRVSLAQALLHDPALLVIDEPTVGLDPRQQLELHQTLRSLAGLHTLILCTHQLREAESCCDRVGLIDRGRLVGMASREELRAGGTLERLFLRATSAPDRDAPP